MLPLERWVWDSFYPTETCWLWERGGHPRYGKVGGSQGHPSIYGKYAGMYAHRAAWSMWQGRPVPQGMSVLHRCDVPLCVRPDHLFLGTQADNMHDKKVKGRAARGVGHANAKLTEDQVREIRARYAPWVVTAKTLAREYGISEVNVWNIVRRVTWTHLP